MNERLQPVEPQQVSIPLAPVPDTVQVTVADADVAMALFDRFCTEQDNGYEGLLDAAVD